jgi:hypothetical protein
MNKPYIIDVTFVSKWDEGNVKTKAKMDVSTGSVFDIEAVSCDYESLIAEVIRIEGDEVEYPVETTDNNEYQVTNPILLGRISRICELEIAGVMMSRIAFERRMNSDESIAIPVNIPVRIVATNDIVANNEVISADKSFLDKRIKFDALSCVLGEFLTELDYDDPQSQLDAIANNDTQATEAIGVEFCELYKGFHHDTIMELIQSAIDAQKESLRSIADLAIRMSQREWQDRPRAKMKP